MLANNLKSYLIKNSPFTIMAFQKKILGWSVKKILEDFLEMTYSSNCWPEKNDWYIKLELEKIFDWIIKLDSFEISFRKWYAYVSDHTYTMYLQKALSCIFLLCTFVKNFIMHLIIRCIFLYSFTVPVGKFSFAVINACKNAFCHLSGLDFLVTFTR